jgi:GTP-binding protein
VSRPVVTIVGRPNVGKSSLFNRILGRRKALVQDTPGVTRDRNYAIAELDDREVILCDTGGFEETGDVSSEVMARLIREQALVAIEESDVLVHVMDIRDGLTAGDEDIVARLRTARQPVLYVLNKCDHPSVEAKAYDFYRLGVEGLLLVSSAHGVGMSDLIDAIIAGLPAEGDELGQVTELQVDPRGLQSAERRRRSPQRGHRHNPRLQFLGDDMPEEPVTRSGPSPQEWDPAPSPAQARAQAAVEEAQLADDEAFEVSPGIVLDGSGAAVVAAGAAPSGQQGAWDEGEVPEELTDFEVNEAADFVPRIALLGRPNVGKSTLLNRLLGYQRSITSPVAGTTHDTVDAFLERRDGSGAFVLIDTAGVRRKARVHEEVEKLTVGRAIRTIEAAHLCLLLVDAGEGITEQEAKLSALIEDRGRSVVLVVNKWDLRPAGKASRSEFLGALRRRFPHLAHADVVFLSALTGRGVERIWEVVDRANEAHRLTISTARLNRWARAAWERAPPPMHKHHPVRLYYCVQTGVRPPSFQFFCNQPRAVSSTYKRYLLNQFRASFPSSGTAIRMVFKDRAGG